MNKNKKGFTLVELLATIVIMAIITTLAVNGYKGISVGIKQQAYENLKKYIETKAEEYANDTGNLLTNVGELVKKGYIEADDEEGNVKNPIDGSILNCHLVNITQEQQNLYGTYIDEEECDLGKLTIKNLNLKVEAYTTEDNITKQEKIEDSRWVNKNILLEATLGEKINESDVEGIRWESNIEKKEEKVNNDFNKHNTYVVKAQEIVNTTYFVTLLMKDGKSYQASIVVRIDKQRPVVYEVTVEKAEEWTNSEKKITVTAGDGSGSGIAGYYVGENKNCKAVEYDPKEENTYETTRGNGTYYVCVKDKAGNLSEDESSRKIVVEKIDQEAPSCTWEGESQVWTNQGRTIQLKCNDTKSGCVKEIVNLKNYSETIKTEDWNYEIRDNAGNTTICNKTVDIYVDKEIPSCNWEGESQAWTNQNRTISLKCSDQNSGCVTENINSKTFSTTIKTDNWSYQIKDKAGNATTCSKSVDVYVDKEAPSCNFEGESTTWTNQNRTISLKCSDKNSGCVTENINNKTFSTTLKTENWNYQIRDNAGNTKTCNKNVDVYVDKDAPSCVWEGEGNTWTSQSRTISLKCSDQNSGCEKELINRTTYQTGTSTVNWNYQIRDNAGNTNTCNKNVGVYIDKGYPSISANKNPLTLGTEDYTFTNNVNVSWSASGQGTLTCDPTSSKKSGNYTVKCIATGNNGLSKDVTFEVKHSYPATYSSKTCKRPVNCKTYNECMCSPEPCCSDADCQSGAQCNCNSDTGQCWQCGTTCCNCGYAPRTYCDEEKYECGKWECPDGGTLDGEICYYKDED